MLFKTTKRKFEELINSDRYKESGYVIQKSGNKYLLKRKSSEHYIELRNPPYLWSIPEMILNYCRGSKKDVIRAFNRIYPETPQGINLKIDKTF